MNKAIIKGAIEKTEIESNDGFFDYNDAATILTPISTIVDTAVDIPNDTLGEYTTRAFAPLGVTDVWNGSVFDFSELTVGSELLIRLDMTVTTLLQNTEIFVDLVFGDDFSIPFVTAQNFKNAGAHRLVATHPVYIGSTDTLNSLAIFKITTDRLATFTVAGFYVSVKRRLL